jgi:restriction endonuclease S subunit
LTRDGLFVTPQIDTLTELGATMSRPMKKGDVVIAVSGNPGLPCILNIDCCIHDGFAGCRDLSSEIESEYLCYLLLTLKSTMSSQSVGAVFQNLTTEQLKDLDLPVPPKEKQLEIISSLRTEHSLVDGTKKLLEIYKTKIQTKLNTLWGEQ